MENKEIKVIMKEFEQFALSKDYNTKYEKSIEFLRENKNEELTQFDLNEIWEKTNPQVEKIMIELFELDEFKDVLSFYVYQNRDLLRIDKMNKEIADLKDKGHIEIFCNSFNLSDNKKIINLICIDKYRTNILTGRLYKADTEQSLFLILKGKKSKGLRLDGSKRYFI